MSPFPTVAPSDSGSPPTSGTMKTLRRLLPLSASSGCPLSADTSRFPVVLCRSGSRGTPLTTRKMFDVPALPSCVTGLFHARGSQTSQVPESTLCTHAPLSDPGWLVDTTVTECHRVLPSACLHGVGFPQLYNISGFNDAACVLATTVLHGDPHGIPRRIRYRPADGLWSGGTCTHWLIITHFMGRPLPQSQGLSYKFHPGTRKRLCESWTEAVHHQRLVHFLNHGHMDLRALNTHRIEHLLPLALQHRQNREDR